MSAELKEWLEEQKSLVEKTLEEVLPAKSVEPIVLHEAMRYSMMAGGKRLRPILCIAAAEACGYKGSVVLYPACAVEIMHTYSLVHDDLPCMDDDDLRRGRPTSHIVYGDNIAVLVGDALLTESFALMANTAMTGDFSQADLIRELAEAGNSENLIGGQVLDLLGEGQTLDEVALERIHLSKTAALLCTSLRLGGMVASASAQQMEALTLFGKKLGLAFQVIDDILDVTQSTQSLGKTAGKDEAMQKSTYPSILGLEESKEKAKTLTSEALEALEVFEGSGRRLRGVAEYMLSRQY